MGRLRICALEVSADALVVLGALSIQGAGETHRKWFLVELTHPPYPSLMAIRGPIPTEEGENRFVRCEQELEAEFQALIWKAVAPISQIHDRMPVILDPGAFDAWLNPATPVENLKGMLLGRNIDADVRMHRVSREVNSSRFTGQPAPIVNSL